MDYKTEIKNAIRAFNNKKAIELMADCILKTMNSHQLFDVDYSGYLWDHEYRELVKKAEELALKKA